MTSRGPRAPFDLRRGVFFAPVLALLVKALPPGSAFLFRPLTPVVGVRHVWSVLARSRPKPRGDRLRGGGRDQAHPLRGAPRALRGPWRAGGGSGAMPCRDALAAPSRDPRRPDGRPRPGLGTLHSGRVARTRRDGPAQAEPGERGGRGRTVLTSAVPAGLTLLRRARMRQAFRRVPRAPGNVTDAEGSAMHALLRSLGPALLCCLLPLCLSAQEIEPYQMIGAAFGWGAVGPSQDTGLGGDAADAGGSVQFGLDIELRRAPRLYLYGRVDADAAEVRQHLG